MGLGRWLLLKSTSSGAWAQFSELKDDMQPSVTPAPRDPSKLCWFLCVSGSHAVLLYTCRVYTHIFNKEKEGTRTG